MISIVIPNWNGAHYLPACFDALLRQTYEDLEIIVVDGGSSDHSEEIVSRYAGRSSRISWIGLAENRGFAGNCNAGVKGAHGKYVALLNNDATVSDRWAEEILKVSDAFGSERVGIFASKILDHISPEPSEASSKKIIQSAGDYLQTNGFADSRGVREPDLGQFDSDCEVFSASGATAVYRSDLITDLRSRSGPNAYFLDDSLISYLEDTEVGMRAHLAGWKCQYVHAAEVYHRRDETSYPGLAHYFVARNTIMLIAIGFPDALLLRYLPRIVIAQLRVVVRANRLRHLPGSKERIRGAIDGLRMLPRIVPKRRAVQGTKLPGIEKEIDSLLRRGDQEMHRRKRIDRRYLPLYVR